MTELVPLGPKLVRTGLYISPGRVRQDELLDVIQDNADCQLRARKTIEKMELDGEIERIALGDHVILKTTSEFEPPTHPEKFEGFFSRMGDQWGHWVRRERRTRKHYS